MHKILHRYNRLRELGLHNNAIIVKHTINQKLFFARWKTKALAGKAYHTWPVIAQEHRVAIKFAEYWHQITRKSLPLLEYNEKYLNLADAYARNQFDLLGSGIHTFTSIPWHTDFRLQRQNPHADCTFNAHSFYKDIKIGNDVSSLPFDPAYAKATADKPTQGGQGVEKDIKIPWELSRFHHASILGIAYEQTHNELYAQTFAAHLSDWLDHNPYLIGINWLCPMEVALRAINWIWAWNSLKSSTALSLQFWERFTCSLYDHMHYLENNWEIFDTKTSNHYCADLVGYLYVCWFFQELPGIEKKKTWCVKELLKEFDRQVAPDGTDYESSTGYHCLVTELFDHMALLCVHMDIRLPDSFHAKHARMHEFIAWCTVNDNEMVKIGDYDSGRVAFFRPKNSSMGSERTEKIKQSPHFGISIAKTNIWHITLRHHAYQKQQPTAHFHNDFLSITVAVNGIPVIIDPGSYLYTASPAWRNHFRSASVHNTIFIKDNEPISFDDRLFALEVPEAKASSSFSSSHALYNRFGITLQRTVQWDDQRVIIADSWNKSKNAALTLAWNFTLHPAITVIQDSDQWILMHINKPLLALQSALNFQPHQTWISPEYGVKMKSMCLKANYLGALDNESTISFIRL